MTPRHPDWCARGHRCNLGEHRADPVVLDAARGRATLTRVRGPHGRDHAEVRLTVPLARDDRDARHQVAALLLNLETLLMLTATRPNGVARPWPVAR